jgi:hypothetical protein
MIKAGRFFPTTQQISKGLVSQDMPEPVARLPEQFLSMGQKKKLRTTPGERLAGKIRSCNQGLAGSSGSNDKVAEEPTVDPFGFQTVEGGLLVGMRAQIKKYRRPRIGVAGRLAGVFER